MLMVSYEILIALKHLKSRKQNSVISLLTLISILGVMMGAWTLTVVLSVLSGFGEDLRQKIVESTPHIIVDRHAGAFVKYEGLCRRLTTIKGVIDCSPFIANEVMLASKTNTAGALFRGVGAHAKRITKLTKQMKSGSFDYLFHPDKIKKPQPTFHLKPTPFGDLIHSLDKEKSTFPSHKLQSSKKKATTQKALKEKKVDLSRFGVITFKPRKKRKRRYPGILLGQELAQNLSVTLGDVIRAVSPMGGSLTPMGTAPRVKKFRVAGIFFTGMYEYDTKFAFVALKEAQRFFKMYDSISGLELAVKNVHHTPQIKKLIQEKLGGGPYRVRDWIEMNRQLFGALQMEKVVMFIILTFIILVASFNIVSTLFMVVVEKSQEIAILKSMGATRTGIMKIFMIEGIVIGVIGTVLGLFLGWRTCLFFLQHPIKMNTDVYYIATLPIQMHASDFVAVAIASILLSFLATIYPALQAANLSPVEGLQHE